MENTRNITYLKIVIITTLFVLGGCLLVYFIVLKRVDNKFKNEQTTGGSVSIDTKDLDNDFVSIQGETGSPQEGNINVSGEVQGSSLTSNAQDGTSPLNVYSQTLVKNLNADMVDGKHAEDLQGSKTTVNNITNTTTGETITPGVVSQYFRGDKTWQALNKSAVGLGNVENTAISTWIGSSSVTTLGTVGTGVWNGTAIQDAYLASSANWNTAYSQTRQWDGGATGLVAATGRTSLGLGNVENTALSTWAGTSNLTTLGTIGTGVWNAGAVTSSGVIQGASGILPTVYGSSSASGNLSIESTSDSTKGKISIAANGGNVGIGTSDPSGKLHVTGGSILQTPGSLTYKGGLNLGTAAQDSFISGNYAYVTKSNTDTVTAYDFIILDISDPANPSIVNGIDFGADADGLYVAGKYAYVGKKQGGTAETNNEFIIYDISNPYSITKVGALNLGAGVAEVTAIKVAGRYAYLTKNDVNDVTAYDFVVLDISNPVSPTIVGGDNLGTYGHSLYVQGNYAYVGKDQIDTTYDDDLIIYNISNPASVSKVGGIDFDNGADTADDINEYVSGKYLFVTFEGGIGTLGNDFYIYDISNPASPVQKGGLDFGFYPGSKAVYASGPYAYISGGTFGPSSGSLKIINVSDVTAPAVVSTYDTGGYTYAISVSGKYILTTVYNGTSPNISLFDLSGVEATSGVINSLQVSSLDIKNDIKIQGAAAITGGLSVGTSGINSGSMSITSASAASTSSAVDVRNSAGTSLLYVRNDGNIGIGSSVPTSKLYLSGITSGNFIEIGAQSATVLSGDTQGIDINLDDNYTATNRTVRGVNVQMPSVTNTGASMYFQTGLNINAQSEAVQNSGAGSTYWSGVSIMMPNITQSAGTMNSKGLGIFGGTVTSGTSYSLVTDTNAGFAGIGTTGPDRRLDVLDASNPQLRLTYTDNTVYTDLQTTSSGYLYVNPSGARVGIGTNAPTAMLDINSDTIRIRTAKTPASAAAACNQGDIVWDANYVYVCVATNTWKRAAIATW